MELRVVDFEKTTSVYKPYLKGLEDITSKRKEFMVLLDPIKKDMEELIKVLSSNQLNDVDRSEQELKYTEVQSKAMDLDNQYRTITKQMKDDLNVKTFDELSAIINEYIEDKNIDMILGKMEVVYVKPEFEITDQIISLLKQKNLSE